VESCSNNLTHIALGKVMDVHGPEQYSWSVLKVFNAGFRLKLMDDLWMVYRLTQKDEVVFSLGAGVPVCGNALHHFLHISKATDEDPNGAGKVRGECFF
jgi:hypothetical protein